MVRKDARRGPNSGKDQEGHVMTDDEIIAMRKIVDQFDNADLVFAFLGYGLMLLGAAWMLNFIAVVPITCTAVFPAGIADGTTCLVAAGVLCRNLSTTSPKGQWSSWRRMYHAAWVPALLILMYAFRQTGTAQKWGTSAYHAYGNSVAVGCLVGAILMGWSFPRCGSKGSREPTTSTFGFLLLKIDAAAGAALGAQLLMSIPTASISSKIFGVLSATASVVPLIMFSVGLFFCNTEAEVLAAMPAVLVKYIGAIIFSGLFLDTELIPLVIFSALLVLHLALYLPLGSDPDSNPFYNQIAKWCRKFYRTLSNPTGGAAMMEQEDMGD
eukprot:TRINITY_DN2539_c1_g1_i1.p1 TRINITY_DN2539_c1_g1~~TRINITY_DN2539_c1_g1_i1.p1  ORF type:complete len:326 (+),score=51.23 TRINITY_DN2539_c1_g1_i1:87-1064(+)